MKNIENLYKELKARKDFKIIETYINGGMGVFLYGPYKRKTVIWSYDHGWDHVSFDGKLTTPTWEDMCMIKDMSFEPNECVIQFHPSKEEYVNIRQHCLHLWKLQENDSCYMPIPQKGLV